MDVFFLLFDCRFVLSKSRGLWLGMFNTLVSFMVDVKKYPGPDRSPQSQNSQHKMFSEDPPLAGLFKTPCRVPKALKQTQ